MLVSYEEINCDKFILFTGLFDLKFEFCLK